MSFPKMGACVATLILSLGLTRAEAQSAIRLKVLPLGDRGVVEDLALEDWKVKVEGRDVKVTSQRLPKDIGKEGQKWVFVFLPVREPQFRQLVLQSVATFMTGLPATDSVLLVVRTSKGLECFTPGFTTRPSLWEKGLTRALEELPARLAGNPEPVFLLPPSPGGEKEEGIEPVQAFLASLAGKPMVRRTDDVSTRRESIVDCYSIEELGGYAKTISSTMASLERLGEAIATLPGEKHLVVFSRNEIDDLAHPIWARKVIQMSSGGYTSAGQNEVMPGRDVLNSKLQTEMMIRDVTLARTALTAKLAQQNLSLHCVAGPVANFNGAFGETAQATGGYQFRMDKDLVPRLSQLLPLWATHYELEVTFPAGVTSPAKISLETTRKNLRIYGPSSR